MFITENQKCCPGRRLAAAIGLSAAVAFSSAFMPMPVNAAALYTDGQIPSNVSASAVDYNTIKVSWDAAEGAEEYNVYCAKESGEYKLKASTSNTSYTTTWATQPGAEYHFIVSTGTLQTTSSDAGSQATTSDASTSASASTSTATAVTPVSAQTLLAQTTMNAYGISSSSAKITWKKVAGASYYRVYRLKSGKWYHFKNTKSLSCTNTGLKSSTKYTYTVRAVRKTSKYTTSRRAINNNVAKTKAYDARAKLMSVAKSKLGNRYVYGAEGPNSFDCSGYVYYCYKKSGASTKKFSRTSAQGLYSKLKKYNIGTKMSKASKGDIVLCGSSKSNISHAAMVYTSSKLINAANPSKGVCLSGAKYFHIVAILHLPMK